MENHLKIDAIRQHADAVAKSLDSLRALSDGYWKLAPQTDTPFKAGVRTRINDALADSAQSLTKLLGGLQYLAWLVTEEGPAAAAAEGGDQ